jgi:hypothetical protein
VQASELMFDALSNTIGGTVDLHNLAIPWFAYVLMIFFSVYFSVLLLNLLIAMMNDTYFRVKRTSRNRWVVQLANVMRRMDMVRRSLPRGAGGEDMSSTERRAYATTVGGVLYIELDKVNLQWNSSGDRSESPTVEGSSDVDVAEEASDNE